MDAEDLLPDPWRFWVLHNLPTLAYMFITHDISTVRAIADDVVVMQNGRIVEQGPKEDILSLSHAPYTELLLSSVPRMDVRWRDGVLAAQSTRAAICS